jgi:hypothetical protein
VTEGYLGKNFSYTPSPEEFKEQLDIVYRIWKRFLGNISHSKVKELVFCIPAIQSVNPYYSFQIFEKLLEDSNYSVIKLSKNDKYIIYNRPQTIVSHQIIAAKKNEP